MGVEAKKWWVLASVACGTFMATLDSSIVNIALPTLTKELGADVNQTKWVAIIYSLVITCLLLPSGRLSDQLGRRRVFRTGFLVFILGSLLCGLSNTLTQLVLCRVVQAVGASMLMVNGPAIITATFPVTERGGALGMMAMVVGAGLISGPGVGGLLISQLGWRSIFWVNVPIGILGVILVYLFVYRDRAARDRVPFDWVGSLLQLVLLLSLIFLFDPIYVSVSGSTPLSVPRWLIGLVCLGFAAAFIKVESEVRAPVLDLSLLRDRTFWSSNLAGFLISVSFSAVSVLMPFFLEDVMAFSPKKAGLFMMAIPSTIFVVAPVSGRLSDRFPGPELSIAGALVGAIGLFVMSGALMGNGLHQGLGSAAVVLALCTIGFSVGLFQSPNNNALMTAVPANKLGVASAFMATVRNLGLTIGTGLSIGIYHWRMEVTRDFVSSLHVSYFVASFASLGAMFACLGKENRNKIKGELQIQSSH